MRKYAYLKMPLAVNDTDFIFRIMLYETAEGVYLFEYFNIHEMLQSSADLYYESLDDLYEEWNDLIDEKGWIDLDDPVPGTQHDAFLPVRVKGRDSGKPQWGQWEILQDGSWIDYHPEQKQ